ncbi:MAG: HupE/UreJ family protein, partial [Bradyrhizobiaceae bacterium]|nr:HupE/UreJ family protein [Bradyrhizobiaceae bacterium]
HLITALLGFNLGVEIGQIVVLMVLIPLLNLLFRYVVPEWLGIIMLSTIVAHAAWHWMLERGGQLAKFPLPRIDAALLASAMRGMIALLILTGAVASVNMLLKRWMPESRSRAKSSQAPSMTESG